MHLIYSKHFLKDIKKLRDAELSARLEKIILTLKEIEHFEDILKTFPIKKLVGSTGYYRLRINNYRLGFFIENNSLLLLRFGHRKDFYDTFP